MNLARTQKRNQDIINRFCPLIGKLIITSAYLFNTAFRLLIPSTVFEFVFFEFSIYTAIKEIIGTGAEIDLWEIVFWVFALIITWYKFRK